MKTRMKWVLLAIVAAMLWLMRSWWVGDIVLPGEELRIRDYAIWQGTPVRSMASAVRSQNVGRIARLARRNPEWLDYQEPRFGCTLLIWAVGTNRYDAAEALLVAGANPDLRLTEHGETALFVAAGFYWGDTAYYLSPAIVNLLLKFNADPDIPYISHSQTSSIVLEMGMTPLMVAVKRTIGAIEKVKALVEGGADINAKTAISGETAASRSLLFLTNTSAYEFAQVAHYLIVEHKADITGTILLTGYGAPPRELLPVERLRYWYPPLGTPEHQLKLEIIEEFERQSVDYWGTVIPESAKDVAKRRFPDTWEEYLEQY